MSATLCVLGTRRMAGFVAALLVTANSLVWGATPARAQEGAPSQPGPATTSTMVVGSVLAQKAYREARQAQERLEIESARQGYLKAVELDPTFPDPHFALASTYLPLQVGAAGSAIADGFRAQWSTFRGQHRLVLNICLIALLVLASSLIVSTTLVTLKGLQHFQHPIREYIQTRMAGGAAALIAWILVLQPILWGLGLYLTLVTAVGLLWVHLNRGERRIAIACLTLAGIIPLSMHGLSRLSTPFNPESVPYLLSAASETPDLPGLSDALHRVTQENPSDPEPHLALGLVAHRNGKLQVAEMEYRKALELGGSEGRAGNNLGNVYQETGRLEAAVDQYKKAIAAEPALAAPHFNLSQVYARKLQFDLGDEEMRKASELDFEGVRAAMAHNNSGGRRLISVGAAPRELWNATLNAKVTGPLGMPRALAWVYDGAIMLLPLFTLVLFAIGFVVGRKVHHFLPTYSCSNCRTIVCRKCLRRIRTRAYCVNCGDTILSLKTSEFTRMLLDKRLRDEGWPRRIAHFILILVVPGWEAIRRGRPFVGFSVITIFMMAAVPMLANGMPVKAVPSLVDVPGLSRWMFFALGLVALYGLSALILRALPEPESGLMETELGMIPGSRNDRLDRAA
jgi:tetratricopeptide (TPR) repeat protein